MSGKVFIDPLDLADFNPTGTGTDPGFTQLVQDTLGASGTDADGFDAAVGELFGLIDALDGATAALDADLDALLAIGNNTDPGQLDQHMTDYVGTEADSAHFLSDAQGLAPPALLEMPISAEFGYGPAVPVKELAIDLGTLHVGGPTITYLLGDWSNDRSGRHGTYSVILKNGDRRVYAVNQTTLFENDKQARGQYLLEVTPAVVGQFIAQVNVIGSAVGGLSIQTFTVTVAP